MNRKLIAIFFIILTLGGNQAKEDIAKYKRCLKYDQNKIFGCIRNHITSAFTYQTVSTFAAFVTAKIAIWLAGFSAIGPVAGSFAAFLQSLIGNVVAGSFFSFLQAVAMGKSMLLLLPCLCVGTVVGLIYLVLSCFKNEYCIEEEISQSNDKTSKDSNKFQEQNNNQEEESFWSSSFNAISSEISNYYPTIIDTISDLYKQFPSMPEQVIKLKKQVLDYSSQFLEFTSEFWEYSNLVVSSVKKSIEEGQVQMEIIYNQLTSTFDDYVDGINDSFDFVWRNREIIKEAFEYAILVFQEQFNHLQTTSKFIENMSQSKKRDACMNNFIEYLANL